MLKIRILYQLPNGILKSSLRERELKDGITIRQEILRLCLDLSLCFLVNFKPLTNKDEVTVTIDDGKEIGTYESMSKASLAVGIPYTTLIQTKKKSKLSSKSDNPVPIKSGRNIYVIKFNTI